MAKLFGSLLKARNDEAALQHHISARRNIPKKSPALWLRRALIIQRACEARECHHS
jgi:hypothetical protein